MQHAALALLSEAEYLSGETQARVRYEYLAGYVYAMAGASKAHNTIAGNLFAKLRAHLRGTPCRSFIADMKVRVATARSYYYPDVVTTCSERDSAPDAPKDHLTEPALIVEVLSPATETIDRREKLRAYTTLESLREYALIDSRRQQVELYRRLADGGWEQWTWSEGEAMRLDSVGLEWALADLYEDVVF